MKKLICLIAIIFCFTFSSCEEEELKPDWEITSSEWKNSVAGGGGLWYLQIKVKNNTNKTSTYLGLQILLKEGETIKEDGLYTCLSDIIPNREYTFEFAESGIMFTDAQFSEMQNHNYTANVGEITVIYE